MTLVTCWLESHTSANCCCVDNSYTANFATPQGLGKTLQTISLVAYLHEYRGIKGPHIVIVPKSTLGNWMNEFRRFCPVIRCIKFHGNAEDRVSSAALVQLLLQQGLGPGCRATKQQDRTMWIWFCFKAYWSAPAAAQDSAGVTGGRVMIAVMKPAAQQAGTMPLV
jgi:hypothetical protein